MTSFGKWVGTCHVQKSAAIGSSERSLPVVSSTHSPLSLVLGKWTQSIQLLTLKLNVLIPQRLGGLARTFLVLGKILHLSTH
jgi:hypothetical protein